MIQVCCGEKDPAQGIGCFQTGMCQIAYFLEVLIKLQLGLFVRKYIMPTCSQVTAILVEAVCLAVKRLHHLLSRLGPVWSLCASVSYSVKQRYYQYLQARFCVCMRIGVAMHTNCLQHITGTSQMLTSSSFPPLPLSSLKHWAWSMFQ